VSARLCWGIYRERAHSPGRESDDAEILRLTAKALEARGYVVHLREPDDFDVPESERPRHVLLMGERVPLLRALQGLEARGTQVVNTPQAVLNTYRERMLTLWDQAGVVVPESRLVRTTDAVEPTIGPVWVKRGDVHNTQEGDVVFAPTSEAATAALAGLAERAIPRAVIQEHFPGDLVKFYGIGTRERRDAAPWFRWFYHRDQRLAGHPFDEAQLEQVARHAARALGLEIFGGDAIIAGGAFRLIDLNAWPSFALYRDEAAGEIARYLEARFTEDHAW
jgi:glutathione synthase/RimK-type ligase-like ATP-grasp enzyme